MGGFFTLLAKVTVTKLPMGRSWLEVTMTYYVTVFAEQFRVVVVVWAEQAPLSRVTSEGRVITS